MERHSREKHYVSRQGWLRATVMGANDGIVSTASLMIGMASAAMSSDQVLIAGIAGTVAGAMSMAAGEYVSVSTQADTEKADLSREMFELEHYPEAELEELTKIYQGRGLTVSLAREVAVALTEHNALEAHARDELGLSEQLSARPLQAAWSSALSFSMGALVPLMVVLLVPDAAIVSAVAGTSLLALASTGSLAAAAGGADVRRGALRVCLGGAAAMALTAIVGRSFNLLP